MSKNKVSFSDSLKIVQDVTVKRPTRIGTIIDKLREEGEAVEADAIEAALKDVEVPLYRIFKALQNSGYDVSYSAVNGARRRMLQDA